MKRFLIALAALALPIATLAPSASALSPEEEQVIHAIEEAFGGTLLNNPLAPDFTSFGRDKSAKPVAAEIPGGAAYQVKVKKKPQQNWMISASGKVSEGVTEGDTVLIAIWLRAEKPNPDTGTGDVVVRLQVNEAPYDSAVESPLSVTTDWQLYYVSGVASRAIPKGKASLSVLLGSQKQTIDLGQYYVLSMGAGTPVESLPSGSTPLG